MKDSTRGNTVTTIQYNIRRNGYLVGIYEITAKEQAISETIKGDQVFEVVSTQGDFGGITEHKIFQA